MTQEEMIVKYIKKHGSITTWEAFRYLGITRLASRIHDLTEKGYEFERKVETKKNRDGETVNYMRYSMTREGTRKNGN